MLFTTSGLGFRSVALCCLVATWAVAQEPASEQLETRRREVAERLGASAHGQKSTAYPFQAADSGAGDADPGFGVRIELSDRRGKAVTVTLQEFSSTAQAHTFLGERYDETDGPQVAEVRGRWYAEVQGSAVKNPHSARFLLDATWRALDTELPPVDSRLAVLTPGQVLFDSRSWTPSSRDVFELLSHYRPKWVQLTKADGVRRLRYYGSGPQGRDSARREMLRYGEEFQLSGKTPAANASTSKTEKPDARGITSILGAGGRR